MSLRKACCLALASSAVVAVLLLVGCGADGGGGGVPTVPAVPPYDFTYLPLEPGWTESTARDVNDAGKVVGWGAILLEHHAFVWSETDGYTHLMPAGWTYSRAYAINNSDQVVGWGKNAAGDDRAFLWDAASGFTELLPNGWSDSRAYDINEDGKVVGWGISETAGASAFFWDPGITYGFTELVNPGWNNLNPLAINDSPQVAGHCLVTGGAGPHAFLWEPAGGFTDLTALVGWDWSEAYDINNGGQVCGRRADTALTGPAFLYTPPALHTTFSYTGRERTEGRGLNEHGQVVGHGLVRGASGSEGYAFVWTRTGGLTPLQLADWSWSEAYAINEPGQIVGRRAAAGQTNAFLATPWP